MTSPMGLTMLFTIILSVFSSGFVPVLSTSLAYALTLLLDIELVRAQLLVMVVKLVAISSWSELLFICGA